MTTALLHYNHLLHLGTYLPNQGHSRLGVYWPNSMDTEIASLPGWEGGYPEMTSTWTGTDISRFQTTRMTMNIVLPLELPSICPHLLKTTGVRGQTEAILIIQRFSWLASRIHPKVSSIPTRTRTSAELWVGIEETRWWETTLDQHQPCPTHPRTQVYLARHEPCPRK